MILVTKTSDQTRQRVCVCVCMCVCFFSFSFLVQVSNVIETLFCLRPVPSSAVGSRGWRANRLLLLLFISH